MSDTVFIPPHRDGRSGFDMRITVAKPEDASEVGIFVVECLREAFTRKIQLGPQDMLKSESFLEGYKVYRHNIISNHLNLCRIFRSTEGELLGYVELGPMKEFKGASGCDHEIICFFTKPTLIGRGIGTIMMATVLNEAHSLGRLRLGRDSVGLMTFKGNPSIHFYTKIGGKTLSDHELSWVGGHIVPASAIFFEPKAVEALARLAPNDFQPTIRA